MTGKNIAGTIGEAGRIYYYVNPEDLPLDLYEALCVLLPPERIEKARRYRFLSNRKQSILGYTLLWLGAYEMFHTDIRPRPFRYCRYGKPYFKGEPGICFNISHCNAGVACAVGGSPVGVDIQDTIFRSSDIASYVLTETELREYQSHAIPERYFTRIWAMKESWVKYSGDGLHQDFQSIDFSNSGDQLIISGRFLSVTERNGLCMAACAATFPWTFREVTVADLTRFLTRGEFLHDW